MKSRQNPSSIGGSDLSRSEMKSRQNPISIGDRILSRSEIRGQGLALILSEELTDNDRWFAILSYEKMNDTA